MRRWQSIAIITAVLAIEMAAQDAKRTEASVLGAWRGQSICAVKESACHDEEALYRISATAQSDDQVTVSGNKIVDGKEINMGTSDCTLDRQTATVECTLPNGNSIHLEIQGDSILGNLKLRDGTMWRRINLKRVDQKRSG
ncbi:MAG: hypothetical protein JO065_15925 [Acidobacteria bacterium]|nr:hypothetical protein [Acidobacteriota bacterium]